MKTPTRLLTADRLGIGLVMVGLLGAAANLPMLALAGFGVLGPPLLRDLGWLKDDDDFTRRASYRAAFHAFALTAALLILNRVLGLWRDSLPPSLGPDGLFVPLDSLVHLALTIYVVSFVTQYWGVRQGVVRVLVGLGLVVALTGVSNTLLAARFGRAFDPWFLTLSLGILGAFVLLAWLVARWPRLGGGVLVILGTAALLGLGADIAGTGSLPEHVRDQGIFWALLVVALWVVAVFGVLGVVLLRTREAE